jgi:hypothetical protein
MTVGTARLVTDTGAAIATGVSSVVPVPLVGDWIVALSRKRVAQNLLKQHGRTFDVKDLALLYGDGWSWLGLPFRLVKGLVLAPLKKLLRLLFVALAVRDVALNVGRTLALGHTLDRMLGSGALRDDDSAAERHHEAERLRRAFDKAFGGIDERLVRRAVAALRRQVGLAARGVVGTVDVSDGADGEVVGFLAELDRRVDHALLGLPTSRS